MGKNSGNNKEREGASKLQWILLIIIIPGFFAMVVGLVILSFLGFSIAEPAKNIASNIPVISSLVDSREGAEAEEHEREDMIATIEEQEQRIYQLEQELEASEGALQELEESIEAEENEEQEDAEIEGGQAEIKELARVYESMSPKRAAAILGEMSTADIIIHMSEMRTESRGQILAKMEPEQAAEVMAALSYQ
ncbi:MotE family protein [Thalassorhabdus alkalitolerans]|uniref:MotE family protein n=1 Tax=Thalassorhabdus alkalitolerans TaxID=2282697 RepID=A0ABW0YL79_9BACI|nr:hypothetical protein [Thalassobacillus sp. C254]